MVWQGGKLGVAQYDCDTAEIQMMPDMAETPDFIILKKRESRVNHMIAEYLW